MRKLLQPDKFPDFLTVKNSPYFSCQPLVFHVFVHFVHFSEPLIFPPANVEKVSKKNKIK